MTTPHQLALSAQEIQRIVVVLLFLFPLSGMGVDLIAPSLPAMSHGLQISQVAVKNVITLYLVGNALGNFFIGFLSDALGRRRLILGAMLLFTASSLLPIIFTNASALLLARFVQGFTLGAMTVLSRAILADTHSSVDLVRIAPLTSTLWGIGPIIGPVIGGYLQHYFAWQACFYFYSLYGIICFSAIAWLVPETHFNRHALQARQVVDNFKTIIAHRLFIGLVFLMGGSYALLIVFNTLGPFLVQVELHYSAAYFGRLALCMGSVFLIGTLTCRRLLRSYTPAQLLQFAIPIFALLALGGLLLAYLMPLQIASIALISAVMFFGSGIIFPTAASQGMALFRQSAGSSAAVMSLINVSIISVVAFIMSWLNAESGITLAWVYFVMLLFSVLVYRLWVASHINNAN